MLLILKRANMAYFQYGNSSSKEGPRKNVQSTVVITTEILRDIRTSTYQICRTE